jgi:hypothetical protein
VEATCRELGLIHVAECEAVDEWHSILSNPETMDTVLE